MPNPLILLNLPLGTMAFVTDYWFPEKLFTKWLEQSDFLKVLRRTDPDALFELQDLVNNRNDVRPLYRTRRP